MKNSICNIRMMIFVKVVMVTFVVSTSAFAQDWELVKAFQPSQSLHSIKFANENVGYTVSSLYGGSTYNIHKTEDGGETWTDQSSGYSATRFKDIWVFSEDTVMMCGNYGLVIHTFDGGENWVSDTVSPNGDHLFGISFVGQTGYVCGNSGAIYKTYNMGQTWEIVNPPFITAIEEIYFLDENYGFVCGLNFIYYTTDGGETWAEPETFPGATTNWWLREMSFPNDSVGFVCGDIGQVYMTTDRGKNWEWMENTPTAESLQSIEALDENNLFASGFEGTVMKSTDGAKNWEMMTAASSHHFYGMGFTPNGVGFICTYIGEVLRYIDPFLSVAENNNNVQINIYPNPASIYFTVSCDKEILNIEIVNNSGLKVLEIFDFVSGEAINTGSLPSGLYFVIIKTKEGRAVKKLNIL